VAADRRSAEPRPVGRGIKVAAIAAKLVMKHCAADRPGPGG
jgi:hypothetical protein